MEGRAEDSGGGLSFAGALRGGAVGAGFSTGANDEVAFASVGGFLGDDAAGTASLLKAITYVADLVGIDHVGIALDYTPENLGGLTASHPRVWPASEGYGRAGATRNAEPLQLPELTEMLLERGLAEADVRKVLGDNFRRVAAAVWK